MELVDEILVTFFVAGFLFFLVANLFSTTLVAHGDDTDQRAAEMNSSEGIGRIVTADDLKHMKSVRVIVSETRVLDFELQGEGLAELLDHQDIKSSPDGEVLVVEEASILSEKLLPEEQADAVELPVENCESKREQEPEVVQGSNRDQETEVAELPNILSENNYLEEEAKLDKVEPESNHYDSVNNLSEDTKVAGMIDGDDDEDDDDWEGIERSELDDKFAAAAAYFVANVEKPGTLLTSDVHIQLDRLHKIVTKGSCNEPPQPMPLMMSARAKWNSWQRKGNTMMSPEVAMEQYISLLSDQIPGWMDDNKAINPA